MGEQGDIGAIVHRKVCIPRQTGDYLSRPRLHDIVDEVLDYRLTLVVAPAGYGKTSLLTAWAHRTSVPVAWFSLDESDSATNRFWRYFSQALSDALGLPLQNLFSDVDPQQDRVSVQAIDALIDRIDRAQTPVVCVLDDMHRIDGGTVVMRSISYFIENEPENMHMVIASRTMPAIKLTKMRLDGDVVEIGQKELAFTKHEVAASLVRTSHIADEDAVDQVFRQTYGWPIGVKIVGLSLGDGSLRQDAGEQLSNPTHTQGAVAASDEPGRGVATPGVVDLTSGYLFEEVIDAVPDDIRAFVQATACVDSFCSSLALAIIWADDASLSESDVASCIDYIRRNNLFVMETPGQNGVPWLSYHALFRDALNWHSRYDPERYRRYRAAASSWYEAHGMYDEAVDAAARAQDYDAVRNIIIAQWNTLVEHDQIYTLLEWYRVLPDAYIARYPKLCLFEIAPLASAGRFGEAQQRLDQAQQFSKHIDDLYDATGDALMCMLRALEGKAGEAIEAARFALDKLPVSEEHLRFMAMEVAATMSSEEDPESARDAYCRLLDQGVFESSKNSLCSAYSNLASIEALLGHPDAAMENARKAYTVYPEGVSVPMFAVPIMAESFALYLRGDLAGALSACDGLEARLERNHVVATEAQLYTLRSFVYAWRGSMREGGDNAVRAIELNGRMFASCYPSLRYLGAMREYPGFEAGIRGLIDRDGGAVSTRYIQLAWEMATEGTTDVEQIQALADDIDTENSHAYVKVQILLARAYLHAGMADRALPAVSRAAEVSCRFDVFQAFYEAPDAIAYAVRELARLDGASPAACIHKKIAAHPRFGRQSGFTADDGGASAASADYAALSDREIEVIRLAAAGMSTKEIADALFVSRETAKKHLANIYAKLGVHSRAQAIAVLRERGLL